MLIQARGNALLVGVGGSGRKSLTRLAAYVTGITCFTIEISKKYRLTDFREDLKKLYRQVGLTCFVNGIRLRSASAQRCLESCKLAAQVPVSIGGTHRFR